MNRFKCFALSLLAVLLVASTAMAIEYTSQGSVTLRSDAEYTTDTTIAFVNDGGYCGALIYFDATVETSTALITITLEYVDSAGTKTEAMAFGGVCAVATVAEHLCLIHPTQTAAAPIDVVIDAVLPYRFNIFLNHDDTDAMEYTASINFLGC